MVIGLLQQRSQIPHPTSWNTSLTLLSVVVLIHSCQQIKKDLVFMYVFVKVWIVPPGDVRSLKEQSLSVYNNFLKKHTCLTGEIWTHAEMARRINNSDTRGWQLLSLLKADRKKHLWMLLSFFALSDTLQRRQADMVEVWKICNSIFEWAHSTCVSPRSPPSIFRQRLMLPWCTK